MSKEFARAFYASTAWERAREAYFISQHGLCEICQNAGKIVHHKIELTPENINDIKITCGWENLELLCQDCHTRHHLGSKEGATREGLTFNNLGELVKD